METEPPTWNLLRSILRGHEGPLNHHKIHNKGQKTANTSFRISVDISSYVNTPYLAQASISPHEELHTFNFFLMSKWFSIPRCFTHPLSHNPSRPAALGLHMRETIHLQSSYQNSVARLSNSAIITSSQNAISGRLPFL